MKFKVGDIIVREWDDRRLEYGRVVEMYGRDHYVIKFYGPQEEPGRETYIEIRHVDRHYRRADNGVTIMMEVA